MPSYKFQSKAARDEFCRAHSGYRKSSRRNVVLSPDYVADFAGTGAAANGFGGWSPMYFAVLYIAERR